MNKLIEGIMKEQNKTVTENGAPAYFSTLNGCLDAFGSLGAMRNSSEDQIINAYAKAYTEDRAIALRLLFYVRDVRGGLGERRVFRVIAKWLAVNHPADIITNLENFMFYGRADDLIYALLGTPCQKFMFEYIGMQLSEDLINIIKGKPVSLLGKWMPSENTSSRKTREAATKLRIGLGLSSRNYRRVLTNLRRAIGIVETAMSKGEWDTIDYSEIPGKAMLKYNEAFLKHDTAAFIDYLTNVKFGAAKINAKTLMPCDIVHKVRNYRGRIDAPHRALLNAMWENQPNYFKDREENCLCMVDTSGSMSGQPLEVAMSLGIYCADKCKGPFHGYYITFSERPSLVKLNGDFVNQVNDVERAEINASNTNINAAFELLLDTAIKTGCKPEEMPKTIYIISDMQFDDANGSGGDSYAYYGWGRRYKPAPKTPMDIIRLKFERAGYTMPTIVYWNVRASHCGMFQQTYDSTDCAIVSGYSASVFKAVLEGKTTIVTMDANGKITIKEKLDPIMVMYNTLYNERYDRVVVGDDIPFELSL